MTINLTPREQRALGALGAHRDQHLPKTALPPGVGVVTLDWLVALGLAEAGHFSGGEADMGWRITAKGLAAIKSIPPKMPQRKPGRPQRSPQNVL